MFLTVVLLVIGFFLLIKSAGWLVDGASALAKRLNISNLAIGLTVVAFGTSAPEFIVNIIASFTGSIDIAIGNVLGSNIVNILLILGLVAIIYPIKVGRGTTWKEIPFSLLAVILVGLLSADKFLDRHLFSEISRIDGLVLLSFFIIFMYYTFGISRNKCEGEDSEIEIKPLSVIKSLMYIITGLLGLVLGGKWVVDSSTLIASALGMTESLIGLTIVAIGTSLPELATSVVAATKKNADIAIGNVVGSNIFNVFFVLGTSATIKTLPFNNNSFVDVLVACLASLLLFSFMFIGKKGILERKQGIFFILLYIIYITYLIIRG